MFKALWNMMCEDDANQVPDPLRMGLLGILGIYLLGGIAMIVALLHAVWFRHDMPVDFQSFGIGFAAWATGGGALLTGAGFGIFGKAKGDALPDAPPPKK